MRQRGSITFWISEDAIAGWLAPRRTTRGGQSRYSDLAIETPLMCRIFFHQPLRQSEGMMSSLLRLMGIDLPVPDHTTLSRRCTSLSLSKSLGRRQKTAPDEPVHILVDSTGLKIYGAGQGLENKHGSKSPREWRKLHLAVDADTGEIIAEVLSGQNSSDIRQLADLLDQIDQAITRFTADGAYDSIETYRLLRHHSPGISVIVSPRVRHLPKEFYGPPDQRDWHSQTITEHGRMRWQVMTNGGRPSNVETTMGRYKSINGNCPHSRKFANQQSDIKLGFNCWLEDVRIIHFRKYHYSMR